MDSPDNFNTLFNIYLRIIILTISKLSFKEKIMKKSSI